MDNPKNHQLSSPHAAAAAASPKAGRKRIHHSPFFWIGAVLMLAAMTFYVVTLNFSTAKGAKEMPAMVP